MKNLKNVHKSCRECKSDGHIVLLLASCMQHDESLVPSNHHVDLSNTANTESSSANAISAEMKKVFTAHPQAIVRYLQLI